MGTEYDQTSKGNFVKLASILQQEGTGEGLRKYFLLSKLAVGPGLVTLINSGYTRDLCTPTTSKGSRNADLATPGIQHDTWELSILKSISPFSPGRIALVLRSFGLTHDVDRNDATEVVLTSR